MIGKFDMTTEEYKEMIKVKERLAVIEAHEASLKYKRSYEVILENIFNGIAYKFDIPKDKIEEFNKFLASKLLDKSDFFRGDTREDYCIVIDLGEKIAKEYVYKKDFDNIIK